MIKSFCDAFCDVIIFVTLPQNFLALYNADMEIEIGTKFLQTYYFYIDKTVLEGDFNKRTNRKIYCFFSQNLFPVQAVLGPVVNFITFFVQIFCTNIVSAAFLQIHVRRESYQKDMRTK